MFMLCFLSPLIVLVLIIAWAELGEPIFIQNRVGKNKRPFTLLKFRTMHINTPSVASHLVSNKYVSRFGRIIRALKFDELPQLINVIKGDMSLVGPRPCLFNQIELIKQRELHNVFSVKPGITGLGQIKGIDMSEPEKLALTENFMIENFNNIRYFRYLFQTLFGKGMGDNLKRNF